MENLILPEIEKHEIEKTDTSILDLSVVAQFARAGAEPLQMLTMAFMEDCGVLIKTLRKAYAERDPIKWAQTIHTLRGASANIGARQMQELASHRQERLPSPEAGQAILTEIQASYDRTCAILREYLKDYPLDERLFI